MKFYELVVHIFEHEKLYSVVAILRIISDEARLCHHAQKRTKNVIFFFSQLTVKSSWDQKKWVFLLTSNYQKIRLFFFSRITHGQEMINFFYKHLYTYLL